jgi:hypothetical protein
MGGTSPTGPLGSAPNHNHKKGSIGPP